MTKSFIIKLFFLISILVSHEALCQESVFDGLKSDEKRADKFYNSNRFTNALELYLSAERKSKNGAQIYLKLGRTYYQLKAHEQAVVWYEKYLNLNQKLTDQDLMLYTQALVTINEYEKAIDQYNVYLNEHPENEIVINKIWRLSNAQYLLEDSVYYTIKRININPGSPEYAPTFYNNGLVLVGNKQQIGGLKQVDGVNNEPFKTLYYSKITSDTIAANRGYKLGDPVEFCKHISSKYNLGPVTFFPSDDRMVFTKNGKINGDRGSTLQLFIAEKVDNRWHEVSPLPFNSNEYSVSHPALNSDGTTLYFVSDMPGGYGGSDLYVSYLSNSSWSEPQNLGGNINTPGVESFPLAHNNSLYFASNGQSGLGGLDMYKVDLLQIGSDQIINLGYPINTSYDDFGLALNKEGTHGFISSNRYSGGFEDNIYELEIDLQTYPLTIKGRVKYKELQWRDSDKFELLKNARLSLIDVQKSIKVGESSTDSLGNFEIDIPYASQYSIRVIEAELGEITVSLDIPKNKKPDERHDIVIIENSSELKEGQETDELKSDSLKLQPIKR